MTVMLGKSVVSGMSEVSGAFREPGIVADGPSVKPDVWMALETAVIELRVGVVDTAGTMLVDAAAHSCCGVIRSLINVTAPLSAYRPPFTLTPSRRDTEVKARILPLKFVKLPSVADEPTWKYTLQARAPLISTTDAEADVVSVELIWKTKRAFGSS